MDPRASQAQKDAVARSVAKGQAARLPHERWAFRQA